MTRTVIDHADMPHYRQLISACGLSAALMALEPTKDDHVMHLLEAVVRTLQSEYPGLAGILEKHTTAHQVATAYLILKAARSDAIDELLTAHDPTSYEFIREVITYELRRRMLGRVSRFSKPLEKRLDAYLSTGKIDEVFLKEYTSRIKTDIELKLLMACFGYAYTRFPLGIDGTGSMDFELVEAMMRSDLIKNNGRFESSLDLIDYMVEFLKDHFEHHKILINTGFHWVAACKLVIDPDKHFPDLHYLDSSSDGTTVKLKGWKKSKKFYFFTLDDGLRAKITPVLERETGIKFKRA